MTFSSKAWKAALEDKVHGHDETLLRPRGFSEALLDHHATELPQRRFRLALPCHCLGELGVRI